LDTAAFCTLTLKDQSLHPGPDISFKALNTGVAVSSAHTISAAH
ncbi:hypothetical protein HaLaN_31628, partial [Haematococcus lacustris]